MDPQLPFWVDRPTATDRLVFADWCGEHDLPAMEAVQRWLAATGRSPLRISGGAYRWELGAGAAHRLPRALYTRLLRDSYPTRRRAEEDLAEAWERATGRRLFGLLFPAWVPDFAPAVGLWG
jgi:hypothetical protein